MSDADKAQKILSKAPAPKPMYSDSDFLSTGITTLNLGCYGRINGGLLKGKIYRIIGKSQSAKSFVSRTILAEACYSPFFKDYELIHDDVERGVLLDNVKFFGQQLAARLRAPAYAKGKATPIYSTTVSDLLARIQNRLKKKIPFIQIVDSVDSLKAELESKMSDGKAKQLSSGLRLLIDDLEATGSIIILVQHSKVNMSQTFSWGPKADVTTGGASPEFYSSLDIRLAKLRTLKKKVGVRNYAIGNEILAHITKNRVSGMDRQARFPLYIDYGIDDIGSCVDYLIFNEHWTKAKDGVIAADEFGFEGTTNQLIRHIEKQNAVQELRVLTGKVWRKIEDACKLKRKSRYPS